MNTPEFRVNWPKVFAAEKNDLNGQMEFSVMAVFPKGSDLSAMKADALKALVDKFGDRMQDASFAAALRKPFRKCKEKWKKDPKTGADIIPVGFEDPEATFINMKSLQKPGVVDQNVQDISELRWFYAGCYAIASYRAYAYDNKGNRGVSIGLNNIQKTRDGEPLGGRSAPTSDFQAATPVPGAAASSGAGSVFD